jgi:hypothetical protein
MSAGDLTTAIDDLVGKVPWGIELTIGTRLSMEFGTEVLMPKHKRAHGEWHLLFQNCHWRVQNIESVLVGSDDDDILAAIQDIRFGKVKAIYLMQPSNDLEIHFDDGLRLVTFLSYSRNVPDSTQWYLFCPDDHVLIAEGGGSIIRKNRNESL